MSRVTIISSRRDFHSILVHQEPLMRGVVIEDGATTTGDGNHIFTLKINKRNVSPLAFSLWILRRLRSIPGEHRLEIRGAAIPMQMPEAIDLVARAVAGSRKQEARKIAA